MNSKDIHEILEYLPHRYPFLLIDRILDYEKDVSLTALKRPVQPGDQLTVKASLDRKRGGMWFCSCSITVDDEPCTSCTVMFTAKEV